MKTTVTEIETEVLPPERPKDDEFSRVLAYILDDLIPIPGTKYRIGLDPLVGLIPGLGDTSTTAFSSLILIQALRAGVPRVALVRMALNVLINALIGAFPGIGDLFSAWFKSNQRNYRLLKLHAAGAQASTTGDWIVLIFLLVIIAAVVVVVAVTAAYMAYQMGRLLFG